MPSSQFDCDPKTTVESKVYLKMREENRRQGVDCGLKEFRCPEMQDNGQCPWGGGGSGTSVCLHLGRRVMVLMDRSRLAGPRPWVGEWGWDLVPQWRAGLRDRRGQLGVVFTGGGVCQWVLV